MKCVRHADNTFSSHERSAFMRVISDKDSNVFLAVCGSLSSTLTFSYCRVALRASAILLTSIGHRFLSLLGEPTFLLLLKAALHTHYSVVVLVIA